MPQIDQLLPRPRDRAEPLPAELAVGRLADPSHNGSTDRAEGADGSRVKSVTHTDLARLLRALALIFSATFGLGCPGTLDPSLAGMEPTGTGGTGGAGSGNGGTQG